MKITHGRKGQRTEYLEVNMSELIKGYKLSIVCQFNGNEWISYLVIPGPGQAVRTIEHYDTSEDARAAIETIANTILAYRKL